MEFLKMFWGIIKKLFSTYCISHNITQCLAVNYENHKAKPITVSAYNYNYSLVISYYLFRHLREYGYTINYESIINPKG